MAPLIVLVCVFATIWAAARGRGREDASRTAGLVAIAVMFVFTGVSHFFLTAEMVDMLPVRIPARPAVVWATGILEICGGVGLLVDRTRALAAYCLLAFLVVGFPANVYAAWHHVGPGGHVMGPAYLLFRAPLQVLFLAWTYWFGLRGGADPGARGASLDA